MKTMPGLMFRSMLIGTLLSAISSATRANDGVLDPTCGNGGKVTADVYGSTSQQANAAARQADGKIVVAGFLFGATQDFLLGRYNTDGSLDASFGSGGVVTTDFCGKNDQALAVAIQSDGKIVAAGFAAGCGGRQNFALARYYTDGSLDASFGNGGKVTTDFFNRTDNANAVLIQSDGKIVAAGFAANPNAGGANQFALARYNSNGSLDAGFGAGGKVTTGIMGLDDEAFAVAIQPGGKIVAGGFTRIGGANNDFALVRYSGTDGSLDASFGTGGIRITDFAGGDDEIRALAVQGNGQIVAGGLSLSSGSNYDFALARYNAGDGSLDSSFGTGGKVTTDFAGASDQIGALAIQSDGKLLAAGYAGNAAGNLDMALARYNPTDGSLDPGFGTGGKVLTDFAGSTDRADAIVLLGSGQLVAAGFATNAATGRDVALARYDSSGSLDMTFGTAGKVTTDLIGSTPNTINALAIQSDGKIVVAGTTPRAANDFALARLNVDGSPDTSFGSGGLVLTDFFGSADFGDAVLIQADGKIVAAGLALDPDVSVTGVEFGLVRYNADGSLDSTFGIGGKVATPVPGAFGQIYAIALQADNRIVAAGLAQDATTLATSFALARYNTDGSLDTAFGTGGIETTSFLGTDDEAFGVAIQADQKIVVAGYATDSSTFIQKFAVARYNTDGTLDSSFGTGGRVITSFFGLGDDARSVAIQADQKILVGGLATDGTTFAPMFALARYKTNGTLDVGFGTGGLTTTSFFGNDDEAFSVLLQRDQKIVVTGYATGGAPAFALARYNTDGTLDTSFGTAGLVTTVFGGIDDQAHASAIQADGKIVAAGYSTGSTTGADFALARYFVCDFLDVPASNLYHDYICSIAQAGITAGCGGGNYCPDRSVIRAEMAVFLLKAEHGLGYAPPACTGIFSDVTCTPGIGFPDWIERLYAEGITGGCFIDPLRYCPDREVRRDEMAALLLKTEHGAAYTPPHCTGFFQDVPCTPGVGFPDWIEQLAKEGVTGGCFINPLRYCPDRLNSRGEMAVFLVRTFGLP
jgi:uncharacterized delta-60 repeat protein